MIAQNSVLGLLLAEVNFPRGPGEYFSALRIGAVLVVYLAWIKTCDWVNRDAKIPKLPLYVWNPILTGSGALGLLFVWLVPKFWLAFLLLLTAYLSATMTYVFLRNQRLPQKKKVLTLVHLRTLTERILRVNLARRTEEDEEEGPALDFIGKSSSQTEEDVGRLARAEKGKGFNSARALILDALAAGAGAVHMEPVQEEMAVRFQIDGVPQAFEPFGRTKGEQVIQAIKILGGIDPREKRKLLEGSFSADYDHNLVDFRVLVTASGEAEKLLLRIYDHSKQIVKLAETGMRERMLAQVRELLAQPQGLFLVCGPAGCGKSTTLYACLNEFDRYQKNIHTLEDFVECPVVNVTQTEVNRKAGKTFATEVPRVLDQEAHVLMISEIRDAETAECACRAGKEDLLVLAGMQANDSVTALIRLIDLGVPATSVAGSVIGVLCQRLPRQLCPECKVRYKPNPDMLRKANLPADKIKYFCRPPEPPAEKTAEPTPVCSHCQGAGYLKRGGIFELLVMNDALRDILREDPNPTTLREEAVKSGTKLLQENGLRQVVEGQTSIQELLRVCK